MSYLVLARKWRPQNFDDLTGQEHIARILKNAIAQNKVAHAYIFSGPRGVGKTSTARILAKALNCVNGPTSEPCGSCQSCMAVSDGSSIDVSEIDGASNTGVDNIRDLRERVRYAPSGGRYKVYIIDEVHMLSTSAFNALLKTLEEPPPHVIFVLATTEPKKIPPTVLSRCQHLPFRRISGQKIKERLNLISSAEKIKITGPALDMLARAADGSMRDSLTILDQIASFSEDITAEEVKDLLGITDAETLAEISSAVIDGNRKDIIDIISGLTNTGADLKTFARDLLQFIRSLLVAKIVGDTEEIIDLGEEELSLIAGIKDRASEEHIALLLSELIKAEPGIRNAFYPRVALEMTLIRLSMLSHLKAVNEALRMLSQGKTGQQEPAREKIPAGKPPVQAAPIPKTADVEAGPPAPQAMPSSATVQEVWNAALGKINETNHPLASKIGDGEISFDTNEIRIVFSGGSAIHAGSVKESLPAIRQVIEDLSGRSMPIKVETVKGTTAPSRKDLKEKALQNPVIREALELFDGRIVDIIPIQNKGGDNV